MTTKRKQYSPKQEHYNNGKCSGNQIQRTCADCGVTRVFVSYFLAPLRELSQNTWTQPIRVKCARQSEARPPVQPLLKLPISSESLLFVEMFPVLCLLSASILKVASTVQAWGSRNCTLGPSGTPSWLGCGDNPCGTFDTCVARVYNATPILGSAPCCNGGQRHCMACAAIIGCELVWPSCFDSEWTELGVLNGTVQPVSCSDFTSAELSEFLGTPPTSNCSSLASLGWCPLVPELQLVCPIACGKCIPGAVPASCRNLSKYCGNDLVISRCPAACGMCNNTAVKRTVRRAIPGPVFTPKAPISQVC